MASITSIIEKDFWFWFFFFSETPCGGLPVLNVNGTEVAQSVAVARYLAREFKLDGKNNVEKAQGDMIVDCITDAFLEFLKVNIKSVKPPFIIPT